MGLIISILNLRMENHSNQDRLTVTHIFENTQIYIEPQERPFRKGTQQKGCLGLLF